MTFCLSLCCLWTVLPKVINRLKARHDPFGWIPLLLKESLWIHLLPAFSIDRSVKPHLPCGVYIAHLRGLIAFLHPGWVFFSQMDFLLQEGSWTISSYCKYIMHPWAWTYSAPAYTDICMVMLTYGRLSCNMLTILHKQMIDVAVLCSTTTPRALCFWYKRRPKLSSMIALQLLLLDKESHSSTWLAGPHLDHVIYLLS